MLKPEIKTKWINALRSGKYKQTTDCLRDDTGYCCLGVLTDIYISEQENASWNVTDKKYLGIDLKHRNTIYEFDGNIEMIGNKIYKWACVFPHTYRSLDVFIKSEEINLDSQDQCIETYKTSLQELNDMHKYTFSQIADIIEKQL